MKPEQNGADALNTNEAGMIGFPDLNRDDIEKQAYFYWLEGGCQDGCHEDHWLRAERDLSSRGLTVSQAA